MLQISFDQQKLLDEIAELCEIDFQEFLAQRRPYLDSEQLVELKTHGHDIGAHGVDHQWLNEMNPNRQFEQMCESVQLLTSLLKDHIRAFSFPFNSEGVSPEICERAISGEIVDVIFGAGGIGTWNEPHCHQRFSMEGTASSARQILAKQYRCLMPSKQ